MKKILLIVSLVFSLSVSATNFSIPNLTIKKIRTVGNYAGANTTYDNTIELWFTVPLVYNSTVNCTYEHRVFVNADNQHIVSAAYIAMTMSKKVTINIDDSLPIRGGACEVSWMDVMN